MLGGSNEEDETILHSNVTFQYPFESIQSDELSTTNSPTNMISSTPEIFTTDAPKLATPASSAPTSTLSPTSLQVSQPLVNETEDVRSPKSERGVELDAKSLRVVTTGTVTTPLASPRNGLSPMSSPLSQALSAVSQMSKRVTSNASLVETFSINECDLIAYSELQTSKLNFPVGCPVWYNYDAKVGDDKVLTKVRFGKVKAAAMNVVTRSFVYKIEKMNAQPGEPLDLVYEDHIAYATSCPVQVTIDNVIMEGEVICPSNLKAFCGNAYYSVMLRSKENELRLEHNVSGEQIKYFSGRSEELAISMDGLAVAVSEDQGCNGCNFFPV